MNQPVDTLREMLSLVTRSLVDHPDDLQVDPVADGETVTFCIYSHPEDTGKLIGTNGRMAHALRVLLHANATRLKLRVMLNICSPEDSPLVGSGAAN